MESLFWRGFLIGAAAFFMMGMLAGVFAVALCQAAAKGDGNNDIGLRHIEN